MKYLCLFISLFCFIASCIQKNGQENEPEEEEESGILYDGNLRTDSAVVDNQRFLAVFNEFTDCFYIINENNDTIFKESLDPNFEFVDFDEDGYEDVMFTYMGNISVNDVLLYTPEKNTFIKVDSLTNFPDPKRIEGTPFYYSYHRSGCADMSWDSDLFYIQDFKTHLIGNISVDCDIDTIFVHKVKNGEYILYKKLSLDVLDSYEEYKWGFIADYWSKYYKHF